MASNTTATTTSTADKPVVDLTNEDPDVQSTSRSGPSRRKNNLRLQRFVFTLNHPTDAEIAWMKKPEDWPRIPKWLIFGRETGESGTPHLQGACTLGTQVAFSTLKTWTGFKRAHLEQMRGSVNDSLAYCSKQDSEPFEWGTRPQVGGKSKELQLAVAEVEAGARIREMALSGKFGMALTQNANGLRNYRQLRQPNRDPEEPPIVLWLAGKTGCGKSRFAWKLLTTLFGIEGTWLCNTSNLQWFDGYDNHPGALFDDFRAKGVAFNFVLRVTDRYPLSVPFKGGFTTWNPRVIIFSGPEDLEHTFAQRSKYIPEDIRQLDRRCAAIFTWPACEEEIAEILRIATENKEEFFQDMQVRREERERSILRMQQGEHLDPVVPGGAVWHGSASSDTD